MVQIGLQISKTQAKMGILGDLYVPTFYLLTRTDQTSISTNTIKVSNAGNAAAATIPVSVRLRRNC